MKNQILNKQAQENSEFINENVINEISKNGKDDKINYDSKYYVDDFIDGLYFCNDLEYAFKEAKAHNRNVMIIFDGAACIYCEYLKEGTLTDPSVQKEINENNIFWSSKRCNWFMSHDRSRRY